MTIVEYDHARRKAMLGPSPENPLICLAKGPGGTIQAFVANWYAVDRLRSSDVGTAIEVLTSLLTAPVGFTTTWNRFLGGGSYPYQTEFTVAPDQSITVDGKTYEVRVIKGVNRPYEDGETWIDKNSLTILKYIDGIYPSKSYTVTGLAKIPAS